ncbi:MAG TPA: helix-turn-helix transcriptional regulator [Allosphingosinicella sp.]|jgi:hypothetical protein
MSEAAHPLRAWRLSQEPKLTLDAAAAGVGTFRGTWYDWETGRRIPDRSYMAKLYRYTGGAVTPNDFYELPDLGTLSLDLREPAPSAPLLDAVAATKLEHAA